MWIDVRSSWVRWVGRKIFRAKRKSSILNLSAGLSTWGILLGVGAIIVVLCVMRGFQHEMEKRLISTDLHLLISPLPTHSTFRMGRVDLAPILESPSIAELKQIATVTPVLRTEAVLRSGNHVSGATMDGIDPDYFKRLDAKVVERALPEMLVDRDQPDQGSLPEVWIGREMAYELSVIPGDFVTFISPSVLEGPLGNIPRMKRFVVSAIYSTGIPEQELHQVYVARSSVESFLRVRGKVTELVVTLPDANQAQDIAESLRPKLKDLKVQTWADLNASLFASMRLERFAMFAILLFTVLIASLNIVSTINLLVQEKRKEISILRTIGARKSQVAGIFLVQGLRIGLIGVGGGGLFAGLVTWFLHSFQIVALPEVYYDRTLPVMIEPVYFIATCGSALVIVLIASVFPAKRAAEYTPLDGLRLRGSRNV